MSDVEKLREKFRAIHNINHASQYLSWDEAVIMPRGGGARRAESLAVLREVVHGMLVSEEVGDLLESVIKSGLTNEWDIANLRVIEHQRKRATAIPGDLVVALSRATSACEQEWREKRQENDWRAVAPLLSEVVNLTKQRASLLSDSLAMDPYDALLDEYEPGLSSEFIDPVFADLVNFLPNFVENVLTSQTTAPEFHGDYAPKRQLDLARRLMTPIGFDFGRGRIDTSHHPFTCGEHTDTRITTRFGADDFLESMYAVLHETGHALYQQGLPSEWSDQPVGHSLGMMIHESQSLFVEMQICRGDAFLSFAKPLIEECLNVRGNGTSWNVENLARAVRRVERGKIRVEADETTYPLHVALRYRLEKAILNDQLSVADIPAAWNQAMRESLGIDLNGDFRDGCMQDVHWYAGLIGYFPCYTLGALTAAQLYQALLREVPDIEEDIAAGRFHRVLNWQRENIHSRGQLTPSFELIESVTGSPLGSQAFIDHISARYGSTT